MGGIPSGLLGSVPMILVGQRTGAAIMTVTDRRSSPRHHADWAATYRFDPRVPWRHCRVIDVSLDGAAIELYGTDDDEPLTGGLYVQVGSVVEDEQGIVIRTMARRQVRMASGRVIVGVEFGTLHPDERQLLQLLVSLRSFV
jgi:hypothetical protein